MTRHELDDQRPSLRRTRDTDEPDADDLEARASGRVERLLELQRIHGNRWVQRRIRELSSSAGPQGGPLESDLAQQIQSQRSNGRPLQQEERAQVEQSLGADLSAVRVHTDPASAELSARLGARAFTTGRDIFFGGDTSPADPSVLRHESAHAVQQGMGTEPPGAVGPADSAEEQAADEAAQSAQAMRQQGDGTDVASRLLQRDDDPGAGQSDDKTGNMDMDLPSTDVSFDMPLIEPHQYSDDEIAALVPGYTPTPEEDVPPVGSPGTAMALRLSANVIQRDDDTPHVSGDVGIQYPWSLQVTLVYRDLNLYTFRDYLGKVDILHEPQAQLSLSPDPKGYLAAQVAIPLVNQHLNLLSQETEVQIAAQLSSILAPQLTNSAGGQVQVEQHIWKGLSATFSVSGMWTPPVRGSSSHLDFSTSAGLVLHLDGG